MTSSNNPSSIKMVLALLVTSFHTLSYLPYLISISGNYLSRSFALFSSPLTIFTFVNASVLLLYFLASSRESIQPPKLKIFQRLQSLTNLQKFRNSEESAAADNHYHHHYQSQNEDDDFEDKFEIQSSVVENTEQLLIVPAELEEFVKKTDDESVKKTEQSILLAEVVEINDEEDEVDEEDIQKVLIVAPVDKESGSHCYEVFEAEDYPRRRSEILSRELVRGGSGQGSSSKMIYRRSETEGCLMEMVKGAAVDLVARDGDQFVDELSNTEFNGIIEAFLEKQKKFHFQELNKVAVLVSVFKKTPFSNSN